MSISSAPIAVIGGSGLYHLFADETQKDETQKDETQKIVRTPYGEVIVALGSLGGRPVAFLPRHGSDHSVAPHLINYRANIWALASLGVRAIVSTAAVGAIHPDYPVGSLVVVDQYLNGTHGRADTFYDRGSVQHLASAEPFCPQLHTITVATLGDVVTGGTVVVVQGPRFSTRAESRSFAAAGGHLVNMTLYPEVPLAAELNIGTVTLAYVTDNDAAPEDDVSAALVFARLKAAQPRIIDSIGAVISAIPHDYSGRALIDPREVEAVLARDVA